MSVKLALAIVCKITDNQIKSKLKPILALDRVERVYLLRESPITHEKITNISPPQWVCKHPLSRDLYRSFQLVKLCWKEKIDAIMGIYLVPHGMVAFWGAGIEPGNLPDISYLDVAPTILALLGVPVAQDMDGEPVEAIVSALGQKIEWCESYDHILADRAEDVPMASAVDGAVKERLRALGYIR